MLKIETVEANPIFHEPPNVNSVGAMDKEVNNRFRRCFTTRKHPIIWLTLFALRFAVQGLIWFEIHTKKLILGRGLQNHFIHVGGGFPRELCLIRGGRQVLSTGRKVSNDMILHIILRIHVSKMRLEAQKLLSMVHGEVVIHGNFLNPRVVGHCFANTTLFPLLSHENERGNIFRLLLLKPRGIPKCILFSIHNRDRGGA
jgi:hypothetical protein